MAGRGVRWCPGFVFAYKFKRTIIINQKKKLSQDMNWAPEYFDGTASKTSYIEMRERMARSLRHGNHLIENFFINRLLDCLAIYHQPVIINPFEGIPDLLLFRTIAL
jgi:hypothetical protein